MHKYLYAITLPQKEELHGGATGQTSICEVSYNGVLSKLDRKSPEEFQEENSYGMGDDLKCAEPCRAGGDAGQRMPRPGRAMTGKRLERVRGRASLRHTRDRLRSQAQTPAPHRAGRKLPRTRGQRIGLASGSCRTGS